MANEKRLIDANALLEEQRIMYHYSRIENAPTVDAVEVVHGRWNAWNGDPIWQECSACGYRIQYIYSKNCKYCPNCGAKMDEERKDND